MPGPESKYNLAKDSDLFNPAWSHGLYNLFDWETGSCYTYDPPQKSGNGVSNGLYFLLGHKFLYQHYDNITLKWTEKDSAAMLDSFEIYLHQKVILNMQLKNQISMEKINSVSLTTNPEPKVFLL